MLLIGYILKSIVILLLALVAKQNLQSLIFKPSRDYRTARVGFVVFATLPHVQISAISLLCYRSHLLLEP